MFMQIEPDRRPHRVEDEIDPFSSRQLRCGGKVRVPGNQNHLIDLLFVSQRRDVQPNPHVHSLLTKIQSEIFIADARPGTLSIHETLDRICGKLPTDLRRRNLTEAQSDLS